ncbi:MAG: PEP-utilizing enzyme [Acidimicrobiales bacterium]|nr:PEP-utilizing enzyme [Acidimicrobiales bacterium]
MVSVDSLEGLQLLVAEAQALGTAEARWRAVAAVEPELVERLIHGGIDPAEEVKENPPVLLAMGTGASPGVGVGVLCLTAEDVLDAVERGEDALLVCEETSPADELGMRMAAGIVTSRGGVASHAAVVARGWGIPAVVGVSNMVVGDDHVEVGDVRISTGTVISIDGGSGQVLSAAVQVEDGSGAVDAPGLDVLLSWADEVRGERIKVLANADRVEDAERARSFGAEGIGLCRTEHMFLGDRLQLVKTFLMATSPVGETEALMALGEMQREDLAGVLVAMSPLPVTVRLLDAPLHEFLGDEAPKEWREHNPMLGTRGIRLAVLREGLYRMQTRAVLAAMDDANDAGSHTQVALMLPLVSTVAELALVRGWVLAEITAWEAAEPLAVGAMIETPRAALMAGEMAVHAEFFSFGTNDLTQMVFGLSRDDVQQQMMGPYLERGLFPADPFTHLDPEVVAPLVAAATRAGRIARPGLQVGVCGEHGGDPKSIHLLVEAGVDSVSCSPFRVPVARLAAAQALIARDG